MMDPETEALINVIGLVALSAWGIVAAVVLVAVFIVVRRRRSGVPCPLCERYPAPMQDSTQSGKSRLLLTILAFVLGQVGAHRFYLRKTGTGLVMLALTVIGYTIWINSLFDVLTNWFWVYVILGVVWAWNLGDIVTSATAGFRDEQRRRVVKW